MATHADCSEEKKKEQKREERLANRRAYYQKNKGPIRKRDNAAQRKKRRENPEQYKGYTIRFKQRQAGLPKKKKTIADSPDFMQIVYAIMQEDQLVSN